VESIVDLIKSSDPLGDEAARFVLAYREETTLIDFKLTFADDDEKWLDVTKDVIAFANTDGGYLVFGVKDRSFEMAGLDSPACSLLADTNNWLQKLNRYVEPHFTEIRSRSIALEGKQFCIVFVPASLGRTHVVSKDAAVKGTQKVVLRAGTLFVRRSGGVHLADARDLDAVIQRRLDYVRSSLLERIVQVVTAPADTEVLVVKKEKQEGLQQTFIIENAPDGIGMKGQTFSIAPQTPEQEIVQWIGMTAANPGDLPSDDTLWKWYRSRYTLELEPKKRLRVAAYSILRDVPFFYWLKGCPADEIKNMLTELMDRKPGFEVVQTILDASTFFGKRFFNSQVARAGVSLAKRLGRPTVTYPEEGPRSRFALNPAGGRDAKVHAKDLEAELDQIAKLATATPNGTLDRLKQWRAEKLDAYLYAQDDQYKTSA
jgi:hypothetical protein